jgi:hypothetical protein
MKKFIFAVLILVSMTSAYAEQNDGVVSSGGGNITQPIIKYLIWTY